MVVKKKKRNMVQIIKKGFVAISALCLLTVISCSNTNSATEDASASASVELSTDAISALTAVNEQSFYGVFDVFREYNSEITTTCNNILMDENAAASISIPSNYFQSDDSSVAATVNVTLRNNVSVDLTNNGYAKNISTCDTILFSTGQENSKLYAYKSDEFEDFIEQDHLTSNYYSTTTSDLEVINDGAYIYYYPQEGHSDGVTLNILSGSIITLTGEMNVEDTEITSVSNVEKNALLSIKTSVSEYYAELSESGAPGSFSSVVTTNLYMYTDNAKGVTTNYALYLNYSNNQIKFIEN